MTLILLFTALFFLPLFFLALVGLAHALPAALLVLALLPRVLIVLPLMAHGFLLGLDVPQSKSGTDGEMRSLSRSDVPCPMVGSP
ncbi:hypothetical protein [Microvirga zambiensis]|uniref:hypothetical protein n=1 Tax=Microvirga zambiensis TaxID=1402137 RepID=UPI00191D1140|nr:hypothetical protein [Microvirga zambiensis]